MVDRVTSLERKATWFTIYYLNETEKKIKIKIKNTSCVSRFRSDRIIKKIKVVTVVLDGVLYVDIFSQKESSIC